MTDTEIKNILTRQQTYFATGETLPVKYRIKALKKLKKTIISMESEIMDALNEDLGKSAQESYMCEVGMTLSELSYMIRHTRRYAKEHTVYTPLAQFASRSYVKPSPYGTVLIMSPWNYPFLLSMDPLIDAIAAGNTVVIKPSAYSPSTSAVIKKLIESCFSPEYVTVVTGGRAENSCLLKQSFDYIFFTGSPVVGKEVMKHAAENLTPVTLELGGKSPCIVDKSANLKLAARRIVFGKFLNCGQTCVAPDYILCHTSVKDQLTTYIINEIKRQYGDNPLENSNYGKIINKKHFERIIALINKEKLIHGGAYNEDVLQIEPSVMTNITWEDSVMQEEIFGPLLPILTFETTDEVITMVNSHPSPLALYTFADDKRFIKEITGRTLFGGGCINDTIIHLATSEMGFGGVGASGIGSYHGKEGFKTFTHYKSIVDKKNWLDLPMRYQPYSKLMYSFIRVFLK